MAYSAELDISILINLHEKLAQFYTASLRSRVLQNFLQQVNQLLSAVSEANKYKQLLQLLVIFEYNFLNAENKAVLQSLYKTNKQLIDEFIAIYYQLVQLTHFYYWHIYRDLIETKVAALNLQQSLAEQLKPENIEQLNRELNNFFMVNFALQEPFNYQDWPRLVPLFLRNNKSIIDAYKFRFIDLYQAEKIYKARFIFDTSTGKKVDFFEECPEYYYALLEAVVNYIIAPHPVLVKSLSLEANKNFTKLLYQLLMHAVSIRLWDNKVIEKLGTSTLVLAGTAAIPSYTLSSSMDSIINEITQAQSRVVSHAHRSYVDAMLQSVHGVVGSVMRLAPKTSAAASAATAATGAAAAWSCPSCNSSQVFRSNSKCSNCGTTICINCVIKVDRCARCKSLVCENQTCKLQNRQCNRCNSVKS